MKDKIKQVIVMRKDLQLSKGQMVAQGSHASIAFLTNLVRQHNGEVIPFNSREEEWIKGTFFKVCLAVNSEEELHDIGTKALKLGLKVHYIQENDLFKESTFTCLAIGPDYSSQIDPVTKHLKLL